MKRMLLLLFSLLLLAGCVEYDEELWLNPDGSGRARFRLVHRSNFDNTKEIQDKAGMPGIHLLDSKVSRSGQYVIYNVSFKFDSIEAFNNVNDQLSAADFWGNISLNRTPDGTIMFKRRISLGSQETDDTDDILEGIYRQRQTRHPIWNYKLHVPWKIMATDPAAISVDEKHRTIEWKYDTLQMWNKYELMTVQMKKGISWLVFLLGAVVLILGVFFVMWLVKINKRSHLKDAILHRTEQEKKEE
jgi:hypothetical protein